VGIRHREVPVGEVTDMYIHIHVHERLSTPCVLLATSR